MFYLKHFCRELEEENASLQAEYEHLQLHQNNMALSEDSMKEPGGQDIITEAKLLRQHKVLQYFLFEILIKI